MSHVRVSNPMAGYDLPSYRDGLANREIIKMAMDSALPRGYSGPSPSFARDDDDDDGDPETQFKNALNKITSLPQAKNMIARLLKELLHRQEEDREEGHIGDDGEDEIDDYGRTRRMRREDALSLDGEKHRAQDRKHSAKQAHDAELSFFERYPNARRIGVAM